MSPKLILRRIRMWPRWTIIPLSLGLAAFAVLLGLVLETAADALSPVEVVPEATMPTIAYSGGEVTGCQDCHFSLSAIQGSAGDAAPAEAYLIEPESAVTPHGQLGCIACHGGDGEAGDKEAAHEDLVADMSAEEPEKCLICHEDLPDEIPGDRLRVPHGIIVERIESGEQCDVHCSDCHGGVGHGFDPVSGESICSMAVCLDCHQDKQLDIQLTDCDGCHLGPHDVATSLTCNDCHTSTEVWQQVELAIHPAPLPGKHGETRCFQCHQYPDFKGLNVVCTDCHLSGHTGWGDGDCEQCHDPGGLWSFEGSSWDGHAERWDQYRAEHLKVTCKGCHFEGYMGLDPSCSTCHTVPEDHSDGRGAVACTSCHQADQPWGE
ncbi:hypothetical protein ACFLWA_02065 [Chloroflexota bacterium]